MEQTALERLKKAAGGSVGIARLLGDLTPQAVGQWKEIPVKRVLTLEKLTGIARHELRPDIYPPEDVNARTE